MQEWDFFGATSLLIKASETSEPEPVLNDDLKDIISKGLFLAETNDVWSLLLGDRKNFNNGFDKLLMSLSLVPAGCVRILNIIAYSTSVKRLDFVVGFIYIKNSDDIDHEVTEYPQKPFQNVDLGDLITLLATPEINVDGVPVELSDVRKAFPVDGEVHVFNMFNPLQ